MLSRALTSLTLSWLSSVWWPGFQPSHTVCPARQADLPSVSCFKKTVPAAEMQAPREQKAGLSRLFPQSRRNARTRGHSIHVLRERKPQGLGLRESCTWALEPCQPTSTLGELRVHHPHAAFQPQAPPAGGSPHPQATLKLFWVIALSSGTRGQPLRELLASQAHQVEP